MKPKAQPWCLPVDDNERLQNVCGPLDQNLRWLENTLGVRIKRRHGKNREGQFDIEGPQPQQQQAFAVINTLFAQATGPIEPIHMQQVLHQQSLSINAEQQRQPSNSNQAKAKALELAKPLHTLHTRKGALQTRTTRQSEYLLNIQEHDITFGLGPAGTGKTYLAVACAVDALERDTVQRLVLTRPAVEAGERLGFLPGDLNQKVDPYLRPLYDALYELAGADRVHKWLERGVIEIAPLAYMRGRTLNHAFVILDEAQNTTPEQMKMFLTRLGFGSKVVITGDTTQIDLPRGQTSGLVQAKQVLQAVPGIAFTHFFADDVVRHPLVARIVRAYEAHSSTAKPQENHGK